MSRENVVGFEGAYDRLEGLIERLDEGGLTMNQAIACYEEASALVAECTRTLDEAELRMRRVEETSPAYDVGVPARDEDEDADLTNFDLGLPTF
ncbi:MAG: exodeoxyribonuclease VII small subunit [Chloroflexia bacterium]